MTAKNVDTYLAGLDESRRKALAVLRKLILETVPGVQESMRYRMPTYDLGDTGVCAMASQKQYISLYLDPPHVEAHRAEFAGLNVGKSCVRFRRLEQLPLDTVRTILKETVARGESTSQP